MPIQSRIPRALALALLLCPLLFGCAFDLTRFGIPIKTATEQIPLPEQIHRAASASLYQFARIGVFRFSEPAGLANVGRTAAEDLARQLGTTNIFTEIVSLLDEPNQGLEARLELAAARNLDLIATGRVLYYLDGTEFAESRVDEEFTIYKVKTREVLWQATAVEIGKPRAEKDYYLYKTAGHPPPPPATLLARNTAKFINLLQWVYPEAEPLAPEMKPAAEQTGQAAAPITEEPLRDKPAEMAQPDSSTGKTQTCKEGEAEGGNSQAPANP